MKKGLAIIATMILLGVIPFALADDVCTVPGDFVLVMDVSGTMGTGSPTTRLDDAKVAANNFVALLDDEIIPADPDRDQAALVSFSTLSTLNQGLTFTHADVTTAINGLSSGGSTNIGSGLFKARNELSVNGRTDTTQVIVMLTDGASNRYTEDDPPLECTTYPTVANECTDYADEQAQLAKDAGVSLYIIGLGIVPGSFIEDRLIARASTPDTYFSAATPAELDAIYTEIAGTVCTCGNGELDAGEECDLGDGNGPTSTCNDACMLTVCGDEIIQQPNGVGTDGPLNDGYEQCELDAQCDDTTCSQEYTDSCTVDKKIIDYNNNGILDSLLVEDTAGNTCTDCGCSDNPVDCTAIAPTPECSINACGAGCESDNDCNAGPGGVCNLDTCGCSYPICGDGIQEAGEECDLGINNADDGTCNTNCELTYCGDDIIQTPNGVGTGGALNNGIEICDDGQLNSILAQCNDECTLTYCGDGTVQTQNGVGTGGPLNDGAEICEVDAQCTDNRCSQTYDDYCSSGKLVEYDNDGIMDSTTVTDFAANACDTCACEDNPVSCLPPQTNSQCDINNCDAQCEVDLDCAPRDGFIATCNTNSCGCEYREVNTVIKDSKVADAMSNSNFGLGRYMIVNAKQTANDRAYIGLDVDLLELNSVNTATLRIPVYTVGYDAVNRYIDAYYCPDHDFDETGITWNNQPFDDNCELADDAQVIVKTIQGNPETWHEFTLTDEVNAELSTGDGQFTIVLIHRDEDTLSDNGAYVQYLSLQYPEKVYRPNLVIT